eukprot:6212371-Pleurochrysis_carterae.AAC.3
MAGILARQSQLNVTLILHAALFVAPTEEQRRQELRPTPMSMKKLADAAEPLLQLLGGLARFDALDASFPVFIIPGLHVELARNLEAEGTLYPKPDSMVKFWFTVQCALEQHLLTLCMLGLWPAEFVEQVRLGVAKS